MLFLKCWVFRTKNGNLYLSIIKPTVSKSGRYYVRYPKDIPKHKRYGLPIAVNDMYYGDDSTQFKRRIALSPRLFPEINPDETKEVMLSITPFEDIQNVCDGTNIEYELLETKY